MRGLLLLLALSAIHPVIGQDDCDRCITEMKIKYATEQKEWEITLLKNAAAKQESELNAKRSQVYMMIVGVAALLFLVTTIIFFVLFLSYNGKYKALKMRV